MAKPMDDLIKEAHELYKTDQKHWAEIYRLAEEDDDFMSGEPGAQWNSEDYQKRKDAKKPALEIDQLSQFEKQVANEIRRNTPIVKVIPNGSTASIEDAEIYRGIIRTIEYRSNSDAAYDTAVACAIRSSIGFIKICTDYSTETGFDQELRIERVVSPRSIMLDSRSIEADGSDAMHAWEEEPAITVKEFRKLYPDASPVSFSDMEYKKGDDAEIRIIRLYRVEEEKYEIGQLDDGSVEEAVDGKQYAAKRKVSIRKVKIYRMTKSEVIETLDFPGRYIPIVPVYGEEAWINGERKLFSLIRRSKDGQRMFNVWKSLEAELLLQQPRAPILAAVGQTEDFKEEYSNPDKVAVLRYRQLDVNGQPAPAPQRLAPPQIPAGIVNGARESVDDIKATMGIYNASLGAQSNETSGIAIQARKLQGDSATYHFGDNLVRAITQVGRVLIFAIPQIYDTPRIIQIINDEDEAEPIGINGAMANKQKMSHFLDRGRFDVRVTTGQSYATRRMETSALMADIAKSNPEFVKVAGDLFFKYMDVEGSDVLAARFEKLLPPGIKDEDENGQAQDPRVAQMQQIIEQGMQEIQGLQQALQQAQEELKNKQAETILKAKDSQSKAQKDMMDAQAKEMQIRIDEQQVQIDAYRAETERLKLLQENNAKPSTIEAEDDSMQQNIMLELLSGIKQSMDAQAMATQQLSQVIAAPRELIKDKDGLPIGTKIKGV